jgi:dUTP pyrophosphatase
LLANGTGIIDSDYYQNPDNDGNIAFCLYNTNDKPVLIEKGERIAQGIFINYLQADNGNTEIERIGGIGSTGKE